MIRLIVGIIAGTAMAFAITLALEQAGHAVFTLPAMPETEAQRAVYMGQLGTAPKFALLATWFLATLAGAATAIAITSRGAAGWGVAGVMVLMAGLNFYAFPHPIWMIVAALALIAAAGDLARRLLKINRA